MIHWRQICAIIILKIPIVTNGVSGQGAPVGPPPTVQSCFVEKEEDCFQAVSYMTVIENQSLSVLCGTCQRDAGGYVCPKQGEEAIVPDGSKKVAWIKKHPSGNGSTTGKTSNEEHGDNVICGEIVICEGCNAVILPGYAPQCRYRKHSDWEIKPRRLTGETCTIAVVTE